MICRGIVKNGRVELPPGVNLPEGTVVSVDAAQREADGGCQTELTGKPQSEPVTHEQWLAELDQLSRDIAQAWQSPKSALEVLAESRR